MGKCISFGNQKSDSAKRRRKKRMLICMTSREKGGPENIFQEASFLPLKGKCSAVASDAKGKKKKRWESVSCREKSPAAASHSFFGRRGQEKI